MRTKMVKVNDKNVAVKELRVKELKKLFLDNSELANMFVGANEIGDILNLGSGLLNDLLPSIFPEIDSDDVDNAYPSELEELIGGFIDVNFLMIKKVGSPIMKLILSNLQAK